MVAESLIRALKADAHSTCIEGHSPYGLVDATKPQDWQCLSQMFSALGIFDIRRNQETSDNGWEIRLERDVSPLAYCVIWVEPQSLIPYFEKTFIFANSTMDGGDLIAVDCNEGSGYGRVFFTTVARGAGYGVPVIASNIGEWMARTFAEGFDGEYYFFKDDFVDLGPVVPGDPAYRGAQAFFNSL